MRGPSWKPLRMGQVSLAMLSCEGPERKNWTTAWAGQVRPKTIAWAPGVLGVLGVQAGVLHLVLLPELVELVVVNGELDKVQVVALDAEV